MMGGGICRPIRDRRRVNELDIGRFLGEPGGGGEPPLRVGSKTSLVTRGDASQFRRQNPDIHFAGLRALIASLLLAFGHAAAQ